MSGKIGTPAALYFAAGDPFAISRKLIAREVLDRPLVATTEGQMMGNSVLSLENPVEFHDRFERGRRLLHDMGARVLGSSEHVEEAVRRCFASASQSPPKLKSEGAFYCWLVRILIDEALLIPWQQRAYAAPNGVLGSDPKSGAPPGTAARCVPVG